MNIINNVMKNNNGGNNNVKRNGNGCILSIEIISNNR